MIMEQRLVKIGIAAEMLGTKPDTLRKWERTVELLPTRKTRAGTRYCAVADLLAIKDEGAPTIAYARVSSRDRKADLDRQHVEHHPVKITAHKIALDPNKRQTTALRKHCGAARVAYNHALADFREGLDAGEWRGDMTLRPRFNAVKRERYPWIGEVSANATKNAAIHCGRAIKRWGDYRKARKAGKAARFVGFPKFRSVKRTGRRCQADNGAGTVKTYGKRVKLPYVGWVRMRELPRFGGAVRGAFVSERGGRWFVTLTYAIPDNPPERGGETLGVDMGLKTLATLSDGARIESPKALAGEQAKLRRLNKRLARQKRGSNRRARTVRQLSRCHARIADIRNDHAHKTTSEIAKRAGLGAVKVETLNIRGMMRNRRLSRAFADAGIADWLRTLGYKLERRGRRVVKIDRWHPSSKLCHACGAKNDTLTLAMRDWRCGGCGAENDRDVNAAKNIKDAPSCGAQARGERVRPAASPAMLDEARTGRLSLAI